MTAPGAADQSPRVWITRAQPGASRTAARLRDMGFTPLIQPLLAVETLSPPVPDLDRFAALAFTSRNGVAAFAALTSRRDRPVFAVGDATAQAAREAGFVAVRSASGDLTALARRIAAELSDAALLAPQAETPAGDLAGAPGRRRDRLYLARRRRAPERRRPHAGGGGRPGRSHIARDLESGAWQARYARIKSPSRAGCFAFATGPL
jgi:hypothetical protein